MPNRSPEVERLISGLEHHLVFCLLFPLLGFLLVFYVWFNFDVGTFIFGTLWLAAGIIIGAIKTKGFREKPAVLQEP